jgi:hypothetical protein
VFQLRAQLARRYFVGELAVFSARTGRGTNGTSRAFTESLKTGPYQPGPLPADRDFIQMCLIDMPGSMRHVEFDYLQRRKIVFEKVALVSKHQSALSFRLANSRLETGCWLAASAGLEES